MRIVHLGKSNRKPTQNEIERDLAKKWILKQKSINSKKALKLFANEIEAIRQANPGFLSGRTVRL